MTATSSGIDSTRRVVRSDNVLAQQVGDETVLLDLAGEQYFGLNAVGSRIWELLEHEPSIASMVTTLQQEFDAAPDQIASDLHTLINELAAAGLVRIG
ncbi:PqqD family protein [Thermomonas sp.]|uniref:PqqD family protein n=1 Tax=Thermomonas sp. TaxID=1971895 RepID=UPI0026129134|nr:PqqD family protein [Thermomonas sp.]MCO5054627.1 PqqD family protein [Thermomonas sp.]